MSDIVIKCDQMSYNLINIDQNVFELKGHSTLIPNGRCWPSSVQPGSLKLTFELGEKSGIAQAMPGPGKPKTNW